MRRRLLLPAAALVAAAALARAAHANPQQDYILYCMGCHGSEAQGVAGKVPPLAGSVALFMRSPEGRNYVLRVPGAASSALGDAQLAAVLNWLAERFPPAERLPTVGAPFTAAEVSELRRAPLADVRERRREVVRSLAASGPAPPAEY
ncbi:MAG TPA: cytochrome c [Steroidobacteraceae bacterium]|nr:cytochrome c [Steroidobacteraceae bacterium]